MSPPSSRPHLLAAGANRHPHAADWSPCGLLAFGAGPHLALWAPADGPTTGIAALLPGHAATVTAVRFVRDAEGAAHVVAGAADGCVRVWRLAAGAEPAAAAVETQCVAGAHAGTVHVVAGCAGRDGVFASGGADGCVRVWGLRSGGAAAVEQTVGAEEAGGVLPLAVGLGELGSRGVMAMAVGGSAGGVRVYVRGAGGGAFALQATLRGHEGWVRSVEFARTADGGAVLASASQDRYVRLWRVRRSPDTAATGTGTATALSNKTYRIGSGADTFDVTFEALLAGHEDWIYTARWAPPSTAGQPTLLTASADDSLALWREDAASGVWVCATRLGAPGGRKGATTATGGGAGGFWNGLWAPDGRGVAGVGRTGSWRRWACGADERWRPCVGVSGHTRAVRGLAWARDGSYLLSSAADQTTRVWARWRRGGGAGGAAWLEFARPQIHGYDLACVASLTPGRFVSGAEEKLLRVFDMPRATDELLSRLCGGRRKTGELAATADVPVLGLSNKAMAVRPSNTAVTDGEQQDGDDDDDDDESRRLDARMATLEHPPLEDDLARHTLWPEREKLYGHGYEISAVATSHDGAAVATACKASAREHAAIRVYESGGWRQVPPPLHVHGLTVTQLAFSPDDRLLLSVGRDRRWAVFERDGAVGRYRLAATEPRGHARMILDCAWAPARTVTAPATEEEAVFATAGRDKRVTVWRWAGGAATAALTVEVCGAATAVAFAPARVAGRVWMAYGREDGGVEVVMLEEASLQVVERVSLARGVAPSAAVTALRWKPVTAGEGEGELMLAMASEDASVRIVGMSCAAV